MCHFLEGKDDGDGFEYHFWQDKMADFVICLIFEVMSGPCLEKLNQGDNYSMQSTASFPSLIRIQKLS